MLRRIQSAAIKTATASILTIGVLEVTTNIPSQGRSSLIYHKISDEIITPILRKVLSPEQAHDLAIECLKRNLAPRFHPNNMEYRIDTTCTPFSKYPELKFENCIGLAAGFDKDGVAIQGLFDLGFGFVEIGSVTPVPQPGNPKPRMFRLIEDKGIINRYGFNSIGADKVEDHLKAFYLTSDDKKEETGDIDDTDDSKMMQFLSFVKRNVFTKLTPKLLIFESPKKGILGINLGKNKSTTDEASDYLQGIRQLGPYADYIVINISSPNTPGLRQLQKSEALQNLLTSALRERNALSKPIPLLIKIAPDLTIPELQDIASVLQNNRKDDNSNNVELVDGILVSNTTESRPNSLRSHNKFEIGGLSGRPLRSLSTECIRTMYKLTNGEIPIIGVGGVGSGQDVYDKLKAGASLVQVYSMMVYNGPGVVSRMRNELAQIMVENGVRKVEDVIGLDHDEIYWKKRMERMKRRREGEKVIVD